jgi:arsenite-transporting ATPase
VRESVLLISTDPAHNLSDAFNQKFGKNPTLVTGFKNLYAMEIDPAAGLEEGKAEGGEDNPLAAVMGDMSMALPGIDEAMGFAQVMKLIQSMEYSVIVFDTAPTGHTLRFLSFPAIMEKALSKFTQLGGRFGGMIQQFSSMMGMSMDQEQLFGKMNEMSAVVKEVNRQFQNPDLTTFVCVCISEFLSLYETERMIQELTSFHIDTHNIVVNQLLFPDKASSCKHCLSRRRMQKKYLQEIDELYEDFHVVKLPLLSQEVRGTDALQTFSRNLVEPLKIANDYDN